MNEEEKELINNIERALNLSEVKGDLVTIIYNYIVKATINLINKLQKELDKKDKVINLMVRELSLPGISIERLDLYSKVSPDKHIWDLIKEYFYKKVEEENENR